MDVSEFIGSGIAGLLYVVIGIRMGQLYARTRQAPELTLGVCFVLWGCSYLFYAAPSVLTDEGLIAPLFATGNVLSSMGTLACAAFTWRVFRPMDRWAAAFCGLIAICLVSGMGISAWAGELEGASPLSSSWYWLDWTGAALTYGWIALEASIQAARASQRMELGLCDAMGRNRLRLWSIVGMCWLVLQHVYVYQDITWARTREWPGHIDAAVGVIEIFSLATIWLVFFPPSVYRRWVGGDEAAVETSTESSNAD